VAEFTWILDKLGLGYGVSLNPGLPVGMDLEAQDLAQLASMRSNREPARPCGRRTARPIRLAAVSGCPSPHAPFARGPSMVPVNARSLAAADCE